ncbi:MAG: SLC13 family permease, partial [Pseudomonadota bacterium]
MDGITTTEIENLPIFSTCQRRSLSRLVPLVQKITIKAGEYLFEAGESANNLYYVVSGTLKMMSGRRCYDWVSEGFIGEEAAVNAEVYVTTALAEDIEVTVLAFPRNGLQEVVDDNPTAGSDFYKSLINHTTYKHAFNIAEPPEKQKASGRDWTPAFGWLLAIIVPALIYILAGEMTTLSPPAVNFMGIFSAAVVMWVFRLVPEYVPAIFIVMAVIVLGLVPNSYILAGYSSGSFFMALSVFGIGAVLVQSGLTYRFSLWILYHTPKSPFFYNLAMFMIGFLLTPVLPSANGRAGLVAPLVTDMVDILGFQRRGTAATRMAVAAFAGISLFSAAFLTAKSVNFALFGLFPEQIKDQFTWGYWVYSSAAAIGVLLVGYLIITRLMFRTKEQPTVSVEHLKRQREILGPLSLIEWVALFGIVLFVLGVMTADSHKIAPPWIGLAILYILITLGSLSKTGLKQDIDWPFLLMLGGFVGLVKTMTFLGIDQWFAGHLAWIGDFMSGNIYVFVMILGAAVYIVRLVVPNNAAVILV